MAEHTLSTPEERAMRRLKEVNGFLWHGATFLVINGFLWFIDLLDGSADFAFWVTVSWGIGLAFHIAAVFIGEPDESSPRYQRLLRKEQQLQDR